MTPVEVSSEGKRAHADSQPVGYAEKRQKEEKPVDLKSVMERVNVFMGDEKKFKKASAIYKKILMENSEKPSLSDEDRTLLFSGIRRSVLSVELLFNQSNWESFSDLFSFLKEHPTLLTSFQQTWVTRWDDLLRVIRQIESDDSFAISSLHKTLDGLIVLWDKRKEESIEEEERVLLGNLQLYVMEILMRLLSLAALDYRLTPTLKSCALFVNEYEYVFAANREMYEVFYKQYKEKRNKSGASKVHSHFTEEDSRNRIHPMRLKGSNPYLL